MSNAISISLSALKGRVERMEEENERLTKSILNLRPERNAAVTALFQIVNVSKYRDCTLDRLSEIASKAVNQYKESDFVEHPVAKGGDDESRSTDAVAINSRALASFDGYVPMYTPKSPESECILQNE